MRKFDLLDICLSLFDGGAAGGEGAGAAAPVGDGAGTQGGSQAVPAAAGQGGPHQAGRDTKMPAAKRRGAGEVQRVLYGKQAAPAAAGEQAAATGDKPSDAGKAQEEAPTPEDRRKAYRRMVEGEYKDLYTEDTQRIIDRRFRQMRSLEERLSQSQPVIDLLAQRYGITDGDLAKLTAAMESDDAYWAKAAEDAGMSVEQYKRFQKLQRENAALVQAQRAREGQERADRQLRQWEVQAQQAKAVYPGFDLAAEVRDPQFLSMLRAGVPVQTAYEVVHMAEIKAGIAQMQAQATEKQVVDSIRAKGARPQENGTSSQSAFIVKDDVSRLSGKDIREIMRRVERGEKISF